MPDKLNSIISLDRYLTQIGNWGIGELGNWEMMNDASKVANNASFIYLKPTIPWLPCTIPVTKKMYESKPWARFWLLNSPRLYLRVGLADLQVVPSHLPRQSSLASAQGKQT